MTAVPEDQIIDALARIGVMFADKQTVPGGDWLRFAGQRADYGINLQHGPEFMGGLVYVKDTEKVVASLPFGPSSPEMLSKIVVAIGAREAGEADES